MSRTLSIIGIVITLVYFAILGFIFNGRLTEILLMPPNEIGDLLAGMFGPLAILWLILGFFQQGSELRQNTQALKLQEQALRMQVEELRSSVDQQSQLVDISRKQLQNEMQRNIRDYEERIERAQPKFILKVSSVSNSYSSTHSLIVAMKNIGNLASSLSISSSSHILINSASTEISSLQSGESIDIYWHQNKLSKSDIAHISISYIDVFGEKRVQSFEITPALHYETYGSINIRPATLTDS